MASIYDKASLVLIPSGTKTSKVYSQKPVNGDGDFTFSRSTAATRVNADGNIEKETQNLLPYGNGFDTAAWTKVTASVTGGQAGYDGTNDAFLLSKSGSYGRVQQAITKTGVVTFSAYIKSGTSDWVEVTNSAGAIYAGFSLDDGTIVLQNDIIAAAIESAGNGYYRCSISVNVTSVGFWRIIAGDVGSDTASGTSGSIYIQDAQINEGLVPYEYLDTGSAAVEGGITDNVPRLDYTDSSCPALLLEPQRTNNIAHSEYIHGWLNAGGTSSQNSTDSTSPEGVYNAAVLDASSARYSTFSISSSAHSYSVYAKAKSGSVLQMRIDTPTTKFTNFDLSNGTIQSTGSGHTASIEAVGNGWYRCIISFTDSIVNAVLQATSSGSVYVWGAQLEAGSYATSYIPTYGTSVTRGLDSCYLNGISDIIGQSQGTLYFDIDYQDNGSDYVAIFLYDSTSANRLLVQRRANNDYIQSWATKSSVDLFNYTNQAVVNDGNHKIALAYAQDNFQTYLDGSSAGSDSSGNTYTNELTNINLNPNNTLVRINQLMLFKTRLSNEELAALTTI